MQRGRASGLQSALCIALLAATACNSEVPDDADAGANKDASAGIGEVTYHEHIRPLLETHCLSCHVAGGVGPFALDGYEPAKTVGALAVAAVLSGTMPPWPADESCNPLRGSRALPTADRALFAAWQAGGFLEGMPTRYVAPAALESIAPVGPPTIMLSPGGSYTPKPSSDEYRCYVFGSSDEAMFFSGLAILPGAPAQVHHAQIHRVTPEQMATVRSMDAQDPALGYNCRNGTGVRSQVMFSFRPGSVGVAFPPGDAGYMPARSGLLVQVHYNTVFLPQGTAPAPDQTRVAFWTLPEGQLPEHIVYRTTVWGASNLPAGQAKIVTTTSTPMRAISSFDRASPLGVSQGPFGLPPGSGAPAAPFGATFVPGEVVGITPHAHQLAKVMGASLQGASGSDVCLLNVPRWDFNWQLDYLLAQGVPFGPDDKLVASCEWDNSAQNQPVIDGVRQAPRNVAFGERSIDEMCQHWIWLRYERDAFLNALR